MIRTLGLSELPEATELLRVSCLYDPAAQVAEELLFEPAPGHESRPLVAVAGGRMTGLVVVCGSWLRVLAVHPDARGAGVGSALLALAESMIAGRGARCVRVVDQPGNYLAPGIDVRNQDTISWLEKRGYVRVGESVNLLVDLRANPRVSAERAGALSARISTEHGYRIRRAGAEDATALLAMVEREFAGAWPFEVARALAGRPPGVHVATRDDSIVAFAAHDGNNRGLGWFGPAGTLPGHRGRGLGEALLCACLVDVAAAGLQQCEIAWIGPRRFYERAVGITGERRFVNMRKELQ